MVLIAILAYTMVQHDNNFNTTLPILAALALGAQRLLPSLQQIYGSYTNLKASEASLKDVLGLLDQPLPDYANKIVSDPISFQKDICLRNISFRYSDKTNWILKNINLNFSKGARIGIKGVTGSGKSTLIDIVMSLLTPTDGELLIDGKIINSVNRRSWQMHIAHVPQSVYLSDTSIEENIALGLSKEDIDLELVRKSAEQAQISDVINSWPDGYQTFVGERGIRLSGGQRQRIGIARALYKRADVLIFDEATSALDNETEKSVMKAVENLREDITIIIIAHRVTTLDLCDQVIDLSDREKGFS